MTEVTKQTHGNKCCNAATPSERYGLDLTVNHRMIYQVKLHQNLTSNFQIRGNFLTPKIRK